MKTPHEEYIAAVAAVAVAEANLGLSATHSEYVEERDAYDAAVAAAAVAYLAVTGG